MQYTHRPGAEVNDTRIIEKFLWLPKELPDDKTYNHVWKWMEKVRIKQYYWLGHKCKPLWVDVTWATHSPRHLYLVK